MISDIARIALNAPACLILKPEKLISLKKPSLDKNILIEYLKKKSEEIINNNHTLYNFTNDEDLYIDNEKIGNKKYDEEEIRRIMHSNKEELCVYYVKEDCDAENFLKEEIEHSRDFPATLKIMNLGINNNNEIFSNEAEWINNNYDVSKNICKDVKHIAENSYEIEIENKKFYFYYEEDDNLKESYNLKDIKTIVKFGMPFFVIGERGSGKTTLIQQFVKAVFNEKDSKFHGKFISVPCGTLTPANLAKDELFGHTKGAYTDAMKDTEGYVGEANGGCLYLDEVQDLSKEVQRMLVKGIEEHKFYKVGGMPYESNFLLVCSSNKPVEELKDYLYPDFYDRISKFKIKIPSIEERKEKDEGFIAKCLPIVWRNYKKKYENNQKFCNYDELDDSTKEKIIKALKENTLRGNFRDIEKLLDNIQLCALNDNVLLQKFEDGKEEINTNIENAINKWKANISNSPFTDDIPTHFTDDFIKKQTWKKLNKMFKTWVAEQAVRIYGSPTKAAQELDVDKNVIAKLHKENEQNLTSTASPQQT